jgi:hypothetical protein
VQPIAVRARVEFQDAQGFMLTQMTLTRLAIEPGETVTIHGGTDLVES